MTNKSFKTLISSDMLRLFYIKTKREFYNYFFKQKLPVTYTNFVLLIEENVETSPRETASYPGADFPTAHWAHGRNDFSMCLELRKMCCSKNTNCYQRNNMGNNCLCVIITNENVI